MGADFKEKTSKTFQKCWDRASVTANTPDLFRKASEQKPSRFEAEAINGCNIGVGESLCLRVENGKVIGRRGLSPVLEISAPPKTLVDAITRGCDVARADVVAIDALSGVYAVTVA